MHCAVPLLLTRRDALRGPHAGSLGGGVTTIGVAVWRRLHNVAGDATSQESRTLRLVDLRYSQRVESCDEEAGFNVSDQPAPSCSTGRISALVVSYQSEPVLERCLLTLRRELCLETVVVDNASSDTSVEIARHHGCKTVSLKCNVGFAAAANIGLRLLLGSEYVLLTNPDMIVEPDGVRSMIALMTSDHRIACVGGDTVDPRTGRVHPGAVVFPGLASMVSQALGFGRGLGQTLIGRKVLERRTRATSEQRGWVSGGLMLLRTKTVLEQGGFDERYWLYFEDVDLCTRLWKSGHRVVAVPVRCGVHSEGTGSFGDVPSTWRRKEYYSSAVCYYAQRFNVPTWSIALFFHMALYARSILARTAAERLHLRGCALQVARYHQ